MFQTYNSAFPTEAGRNAIIEVMRHPAKYHNQYDYIQPVPVTLLMQTVWEREFSVTAFLAALAASNTAMINKSDPNGYTALHLAVLRGNEYACRILLQAGARPDAKAVGNVTALHIASESYGRIHPNILRLLIAHGAPTDDPMIEGLTPLLQVVL